MAAGLISAQEKGEGGPLLGGRKFQGSRVGEGGLQDRGRSQEPSLRTSTTGLGAAPPNQPDCNQHRASTFKGAGKENAPPANCTSETTTDSNANTQRGVRGGRRPQPALGAPPSVPGTRPRKGG